MMERAANLAIYAGCGIVLASALLRMHPDLNLRVKYAVAYAHWWFWSSTLPAWKLEAFKVRGLI